MKTIRDGVAKIQAQWDSKEIDINFHTDQIKQLEDKYKNADAVFGTHQSDCQIEFDKMKLKIDQLADMQTKLSEGLTTISNNIGSITSGGNGAMGITQLHTSKAIMEYRSISNHTL